MCKLPDCDRPVTARGLCGMHYRRVLRGQDLSLPPRTGGVVKYQMAHHRVKMLWGSASIYACIFCGAPAREWSYDGTDPSEFLENVDGCVLAYSIHPEFYRPLCVTCHRNYDVDMRDGRRKECSKDGCRRLCHAKGLCGSHYVMENRDTMKYNSYMCEWHRRSRRR